MFGFLLKFGMAQRHKHHPKLPPELAEVVRQITQAIKESEEKITMQLTDLTAAILALDTTVLQIAAAIGSNPSSTVPQPTVDALTKLQTDLAALLAQVTPAGGIPTAPGGLAAVNATPGPGSVALSWSPVPGATSYNVKSSAVAGGPYTNVTTSSPIMAPSVTVPSPSGVQVFYVVSAVNAAGESPNSVEVSATPA